MGGDEMIDFEADNYDDLCERFIEKHRTLWEDFVYNAYNENCADQIDHAKDIMDERGM